MKYQVLFSLRNNDENNRMSSASILLDALMVIKCTSLPLLSDVHQQNMVYIQWFYISLQLKRDNSKTKKIFKYLETLTS